MKVSEAVSPTVLLYLFVVISQIIEGFYAASPRESLEFLSLISRLGFLWILGWWLIRDSKKRRVGFVYDIGFFISVALPIVLPYYLIKTRGAKGVLVIFAFVGTYICALILGMALYWLSPS